MSNKKYGEDGRTDIKEAGCTLRGRRRFLGAGSAVTPVILTMLSQPALGTTCFTPSRALSRNTSVSQEPFIGDCMGAQSPGNYKAQLDPISKNGGSYSWPIPPTTAFHPTFAMGTTSATKFVKLVNNNEVSMSMAEVLNSSADSQQVAFHLIAAYLNCLNNWVDPKAMTAAGVTKIWGEYVTKGFYEPMGGVRWYATEIKSYLISNNIVK